MAEEEKKIIVDDDWKAEAKQEKERLAQETVKQEPLPEPTFAELINMIAMQVMVGLGGVSGPGGERIPPSLEVAKHYVDMLQMLEDKTKNNLTDEEKKLLDQVLYEMRMRYVQTASGGAAPPATPK
ncbi:MAG: DUF1844 domain-containing protein [Phycisphaerae bacterium]